MVAQRLDDPGEGREGPERIGEPRSKQDDSAMLRSVALCGASGGGGAPDEDTEALLPQDLDQGLSAAQLRAVTLLLVGRSAASVARTLGVSRMTVFRWRQQRAFSAFLRFRQEALFNQARDRLRATLVRAVREIERELRSKLAEQRLRAAFRLLPYVGAPRLRAEEPRAAARDPKGSAVAAQEGRDSR